MESYYKWRGFWLQQYKAISPDINRFSSIEYDFSWIFMNYYEKIRELEFINNYQQNLRIGKKQKWKVSYFLPLFVNGEFI